jgi:hypothetical protein
MPQPKKKHGTQSKQFQLSARFQRYICRNDQTVGEEKMGKNMMIRNLINKIE